MILYRHFLLLLVLLISSFWNKAISQVITSPGDEIICYASDDIHRSYISPMVDIIEGENAGRLNSNNPFIVEYNNVPSAGHYIIDYATKIWATIISTPFPIRISVSWKELNEGTLGSARPGSRKANFDGAPIRGLLYPIALAERLARKELNEPDEYEIIISINQERAWYFGTDGQVTEGLHDFLSVILHEIGHGLGLSDTFDSEGNIGSWGIDGKPSIYDYFIINNKEQQLIDKDVFENNSINLHKQLTSKNIQYACESARDVNNDQYPEIYAPADFNSGSSISHLDEDAYPAGDINSLMTPKLSREEAIHNPGSIVNSILADMGYVWTFIDPDRVPDQPDWNQDVVIIGSIKSDSALIADSAFIYYSFDEFNTMHRAELSLNANQTEFTAVIEAPGTRSWVDYYFQVTGNNNVMYRSPVNDYLPNYNFGFGLVTNTAARDETNYCLMVYPNPTNGLFRVKYLTQNNNKQAYLTITTLHGKTIFNKKINLSGGIFEDNIDLRGQSTGLYIMQVFSMSGIFKQSFVIR